MSAVEVPVGDPEVRWPRVPSWLSSAASVGTFGLLPALLTARLMFQHGFGWDFRAFYDGARAYLDGTSPYPRDSLAALANKQQFVYPAPAALLFAPLALLPYTAALAVWVGVSIAAIALALRVLGVSDWRCFGALLLTLPAEHAVRLGTLGPLLLLLLALLWRYRDRVLPAAGLASVVALSKVFLSPLLLWLVFTRRVRTAALAASLAVAICLLAWLPLGESSILGYPSLLGTLAQYEQTFSYSLTSLLVGLGLTPTTSLGLALAAGLTVLCVAYTRRHDDELVFRLALGACFLLSPIVWGHYFLLLAVPLALRRPRLGPAWLLALWIKSDTLALRHASVFVALALIVMAVQLGIRLPLGSRPWVRSTRIRPLLVLAAVAATWQFVNASSTDAGYTRNAALTAIAGNGRATGAGSLQIDRPDRRLCWRVWTEALQTRPALVAVEPLARTGRPVTFHTRIANAQAQGCATLPAADRRLVRGLIDSPTRYRLVLAVPTSVAIAGVLRGQ